MDELQAKFQTLRLQADKTSASVAQASSEATEIARMRENIADNIKGIPLSFCISS
jgi:hypothetical protein